MAKILQWLADGLANAQEPDLGSLAKEKGVGDMPLGQITDPEVRRLFGFRLTLIDQLEAAHKKCETVKEAARLVDHSNHDRSKCAYCLAVNEVRKIEERLEIVGDILGFQIKEALAIDDQVLARRAEKETPFTITVRKDWKVVLARPELPDMNLEIFEISGGLVGGSGLNAGPFGNIQELLQRLGRLRRR